MLNARHATRERERGRQKGEVREEIERGRSGRVTITKRERGE